MAESSLSLGFTELQQAVGLFLGYGRTVGNWDADQTARVEAIVQAGVRTFYFPPALPEKLHPHRWSFLRPTTTLATTADDYDQDMPDDFGGIVGDFSFDPDDGYAEVRVVGEADIRSKRQVGTVTGRPAFAAIRPKASTGVTGQRFEVLFWPTPDAVYTLSYRYNALTNKLSSSAPYPLGGMQHAETIKASCVTQAELEEDNIRGPQYQNFMDKLQASVLIDQLQGPAYFGSNTDGSDGQEPLHVDRTGLVTNDGRYST